MLGKAESRGAKILLNQSLRCCLQQDGVVDVHRAMEIRQMRVRKEFYRPLAAYGIEAEQRLDPTNMPGLAPQLRVICKANERKTGVCSDRLLAELLIVTNERRIDAGDLIG